MHFIWEIFTSFALRTENRFSLVLSLPYPPLNCLSHYHKPLLLTSVKWGFDSLWLGWGWRVCVCGRDGPPWLLLSKLKVVSGSLDEKIPGGPNSHTTSTYTQPESDERPLRDFTQHLKCLIMGCVTWQVFTLDKGLENDALTGFVCDLDVWGYEPSFVF